MTQKDTQDIRYQRWETAIISAVWILIYLIPVFSNYSEPHAFGSLILSHWIIISTYLIIFLVHFYWLIPTFLLRNLHFKYIIYSLLTAALLVFVGLWLENLWSIQQITGMPPMELGPGMPPMELGPNMQLPMGYESATVIVTESPALQNLFNFLVALLIMGTSSGYKLKLLWIREEKQRKELEAAAKESGEENEYIFVKSDYKMVKIRIRDILYIESANEYIRIWMEDGQHYMTFMRLKNILTNLPVEQFMRVQRSFIINLQRIKAVDKNRVYFDSNKSVPIGEQYKEEFQDYMDKNFSKVQQ